MDSGADRRFDRSHRASADARGSPHHNQSISNSSQDRPSIDRASSRWSPSSGNTKQTVGGVHPTGPVGTRRLRAQLRQILVSIVVASEPGQRRHQIAPLVLAPAGDEGCKLLSDGIVAVILENADILSSDGLEPSIGLRDDILGVELAPWR
jgi:hypothetical protein